MRTSLLALLALLALPVAGCKKDLVCPAGETDCGDRCVSLLSDPSNCGACGVRVGALETCSAGQKVCAPGIGSCDGTCTDLARDAANCGGCGSACAAGDLCTTTPDATSCLGACPTGYSPCGRACVDVSADRFHCGACGVACGPGEQCRAGQCRADVAVACFYSGDVRSWSADLSVAGPVRPAQGSPTVLAATPDALYAGSGFPAALATLPLDVSGAGTVTVLAGNDVQGVTAFGGTVLVSNAGTGTLVVLDATGAVLDELLLPGEAPNPHGVAVLGTTAWVALYGNGPAVESGAPFGQKVAKVDLSALPACAADTAPPACGTGGACESGRECRDGACRVRCGEVVGTIDLLGVPGAATAPGYPFPNQVVTSGSRVFVSLSNLDFADFGGGFAGWFKPAGPGKVAVIDTSRGDAVSVFDLAGCGNPGDLAIEGATLWATCGSFSFPDLAPGALVAVNLGGPLPPPGTLAVDLPALVPGNLAFCGGKGYVTDQASGRVVRFDPATFQKDDPVSVCPSVCFDPNDPFSCFAWAADVACP